MTNELEMELKKDASLRVRRIADNSLAIYSEISLLVEDNPEKMREYEKMKNHYGMLGLPISEVPKLNPSGNMSESYFAHPIKE